jgi:ArsR family transcriptional regulator
MNNDSLVREINQLHADICSALADPTRILLLYALASQPMNVGDLAIQINASQPTTSRHLKILRDRGLVRAERLGANVEYQITDHRLIDALDLLRQVLRDRIHYRASIVDSNF